MCTAEEVQKIVHTELDNKLAGFIKQSWYVLIGLVVSSAGAWFSLFYQVQAIDTEQKQQAVATKEAIIENQKQIDTLRTDYKADLSDIKQDLRYIRERI